MGASEFFVGDPMIYTCGRSGNRCGVENKRLRIEELDEASQILDIFCECGERLGCRRLSNREVEERLVPA